MSEKIKSEKPSATAEKLVQPTTEPNIWSADNRAEKIAHTDSLSKRAREHRTTDADERELWKNMTKIAHTPGPWKLEDESSVGPKGDASVHYDIANVGSIYFGDANIKTEAELMARMEANARLIAAAPELLEAGRMALNRLERLENYDALSIDWSPATKALRSAIAKAQGLSPSSATLSRV